MFGRIGTWRHRDPPAARPAMAGRDRPVPDLSAVPPFPAEIPGGLAAVDPQAIGSYVGVGVVAVTSLAVTEPTPPAATPGHPLGALIAGQHDARKARLRASGMNEDQIDMVVSAISDAVTQHRQNAWNVVFASGDQVAVQVYARGEGHGDFAGYKAAYDHQVGRSSGVLKPILDGRVHGIPEAHYETYRLGSVVVAMGREHEAVVKAGRPPTGHGDRSLAALAALGLWAVEG